MASATRYRASARRHRSNARRRSGPPITETREMYLCVGSARTLDVQPASHDGRITKLATTRIREPSTAHQFGRYANTARPTVGLHTATHERGATSAPAIKSGDHWPDSRVIANGAETRIQSRCHPSRVRPQARRAALIPPNVAAATAPDIQAS